VKNEGKKIMNLPLLALRAAPFGHTSENLEKPAKSTSGRRRNFAVRTVLGFLATALAWTLATPAASAEPPLNSSPVAMSRTPDGGGYWIATQNGSIANYGNAQYYNSLPGLNVHVNNIVGITATPTGHGYWLAGSDGGVFSFGDAQYYNSLPGLNVHVNNIVGITATPTGHGYWLAGSDGGVFSFGDAQFYQSLGGIRLNEPVAGIAATPSGNGYWLIARDGGVFAFGGAAFYGRPQVTGAAPVPQGRSLPSTFSLSSAGVNFYTGHEGFVPRAKPDPKGYCTIGFGHLIRRGPCTQHDIDSFGTISLSTAKSIALTDVGWAQDTIRNSLRNTSLSQQEFDSLVDFVANVGSGQYSTSSIQRDLTASPPRYSDVPGDYMKWTADKLCGIYRRRLDEGNLFGKGSYAPTSAACPAGYR
jgi:GH24 family phage-related lysozyme (muramidase)